MQKKVLQMPETATLRLDDNRPLSNFIETATKRYIEQSRFADEFETAEIKDNKALNKSIRRGHRDAAGERGHFVDMHPHRGIRQVRSERRAS
jgi:hypothetical protein